ncbi:MAG TPA: hypothetical protein VFB69_02295 [Candidatus Dormibacteraeota bacterium]|nr:hypothetical protein [Candidatus Dormibacteraeota bacterium]
MRLLVATASVAVLLAACGTVSSQPVASSPPPSSVNVLSAKVVPGVPYTTRGLSASDLSKDASLPDLTSMLSTWGYVEGAERTFQGQSRHLTFVVSRTLVFTGAAGAQAYVSFIHTNVVAYFGVVAESPLTAQGRSGWQITPSACACHMANPVEVGVVSSGATVSWLEINGPDATPALLVSLLDPSNTVPAA